MLVPPVVPLLAGGALSSCTRPPAPPRPNILCITWEDTSPRFGCYGDPLARTPAIDALAADGIRFSQAFATAPVCSPSRSTIITARWPLSLGSQHHRSLVPLPSHLRCFPAYLRDAGYFCYNNAKTDYNFTPPAGTWDMCSPDAHWRKRPAGRPFFAVHNLAETHQGAAMFTNTATAQRALLPPPLRVAPKDVVLPPYYPDTPSIRQHLANHYNNIALADRRTAALLQQLRDDGLYDNTIIIFYSDHGDGLPRAKLHLYQAGLHVPLLIRIPPHFYHRAMPPPGSVVSQLVTLMDIGPTLLSLAGIRPPPGLHGRALLGPFASPPPRYVAAHRDRIESVAYCARSLYDGRWRYVCNFRPDIELHAPMFYHEDDPALREMRALYHNGSFSGPPAAWLAPHAPPEELYDTCADPHCITNLAPHPSQHARLAAFRAALRAWQSSINDLGLVPESLQHTWSCMYGAPALIPSALLHNLPQLACAWQHAPHTLLPALVSSNAAERYWAVLGLGLGHATSHVARITACLDDPEPCVACAAVWALHRMGDTSPASLAVLSNLLCDTSCERLTAMETARRIGPAAAPLAPLLRTLAHSPGTNDFYDQYVPAAAAFALDAMQ